MRFSLVVTCFNEMKSLPNWHMDIESQTRKPDEIVIVDSGSTDGTIEFLRDWQRCDARVRVIVQKCSPARGHNIGNQAAKNRHIVSTDMGIRIDAKWFEEIVRPFEDDPSVEIVAGSFAVDKDTIKSPAARAEYYIGGDGVPRLEPGFVPSNRSMAYTKEVWRELGGLPEDLTRYADDSVFGRQMVQAGCKMGYAPRAMVYWPRHSKLRDFWKEQYGYGRGDGEASIKTPVAFKLYRRKIVPKILVPFLTACRCLQKHIGGVRLGYALRKGDFMGLAFVPLLLLGNGWYFAKGYLEGDLRGQTECLECRNRDTGPEPWPYQ